MMVREGQEIIPEEAHMAALVGLSRYETQVFELLRVEVELFPATLEILTGRIVSSDLQSKEELLETGAAVVERLLIDQWSPRYEFKVRGIMEKLWGVERWENYRHIGGSENSLQHSLRDLHLVSLISDLEEREGFTPDVDFLFRAFILHDMGEIDLGDTLYKDKTLKREQEEYEKFCQLISFLSPKERKEWRYYYLGQYIRFTPEASQERFRNMRPFPLPVLEELQERYEHEGKIFDAAERIGYLLYAVHCFTNRHQIAPLIQVLRHQHRHLVRLSEELSSVGRYIYTPRVVSWAEDLLRNYEGVYLEK